MTPQIVLESSPAMNRRQPLLPGEKRSPDRRGVGEVAGGAAAECAAIWCCCPLAIIDLVVMAVYKVPSGLCRKARRKKKKKKKRGSPIKKEEALLQQQQPSKSGPDSRSDEPEIDRFLSDVGDGTAAAVDFDAEMWGRFHGSGFWRSPSHRDV